MNQKKNKKTCYISTPIYYPSGNLHLGHLFTTTIAWSYARFRKKQNWDVFFVTGQDEHGQKIENKAKVLNLEPQEYVDQQYKNFVDFWKKANIEYDFYSRTTNKEHQELVNQVFDAMLKKDYIYKGVYQGLYSIQDEEFVTQKEAIEKDNKFYHPISKHELVFLEEESYFFKLEKLRDWLEDYCQKNPNFVKPNKIWKELQNNFINKGLSDLSISRVNFKWGISINKNPKHIIYVWLDALFSYLSALSFNLNNKSDNYLKYWEEADEIVQILGKEISRFHCIFWPIFLKSLDIKIPDRMIVHGWIITNSGKMSKSKGNVINPLDLFKNYDPEVIKYYLLSHFNIFDDSVFDYNELKLAYNADLANNIGNLFSRTIKMIKNSFNKPVQYHPDLLNKDDLYIQDLIILTNQKFVTNYESFNIDKAYKKMLFLAKELNRYIDITAPWLLKDNLKRLEIILNTLLNGIYALLTFLDLVMPKTVEKFRQSIKINKLSFEQIKNFYKFDNVIVEPIDIVFPRLK